MLDRIIGKSADAKQAAQDAKTEGDGTEGHWTGATWFHGGQTWLHEQGPEIVNLPSGAQVIPHSESLKQEYERGLNAGKQNGQGGVSIVIPKLADTIVVKEKQDIDNIMNQLTFKLKSYAINAM